jgi:hypothetical protein
MDNLIFAIFGGVCLAIGAWLGLWWRRRGRRGGAGAPAISIMSSIEGLRAVGELVVLKVVTQQIVTKSDHLLGDWGEKWLAWLLSSKKTAMIFEFVVDFRYDLRDARFQARLADGGSVEFQMPPCFYEIQMKDIRIYDERASALVPVILPEWIGQIFGGKFSEKEKNQLIRAARMEAEGLARQLAGRMMGEVRHSADATLRLIARGIGCGEVRCLFQDQPPEQRAIDVTAIEQSADRAVVESK